MARASSRELRRRFCGQKAVHLFNAFSMLFDYREGVIEVSRGDFLPQALLNDEAPCCASSVDSLISAHPSEVGLSIS